MAYKRASDPFINELLRGRLLKNNCKAKGCSSYGECSRIPTEIVGKGDVDIFFIGGPPTDHERELCRPFSSRNGTTLRNIVFRLQREYKKKITYALAHSTRNCEEEIRSKTITDSESEYCLELLKEEILRLNPKTIVLLGRDAINAVLQTKLNIDSYHGKFNNFRIGDKKFRTYITYNPSFGVRNPDRLGDIYTDIAYLFGRKRPTINVTYGPNGEKQYKILTKINEIKRVLKKLSLSSKPLVFDTEAKNVSKFNNEVLMLQFYNGGKYGYAIPWLHRESPFSEGELEQIKGVVNELLSKKSKYPFIIGHNLKFEFVLSLIQMGITIRKPLFDTMVGAYLLDETHTREDDDDTDATRSTSGYGLGSQLIHYGFSDDWYFQAKSNRANLSNESLDYVARYGVGDVVLNYELARCQFEEAKAQNYTAEWKNLILNFYSHQIKLFSDLELNGILVDIEYLGHLMDPENSPLLKFIRDLKKKFYALPNVKKANKKLNLKQRSIFGDVWMFDIQKPEHKQLLFIDVMGLEPLKYGKLKDGSRGAPSLDKEFQKHYMDEHKEVEYLFYLSKANQLFSLYPKSFHEILSTNPDCSDGRVRPSFFGTRTRSGRGAARKPNTQQTIRSGETDSIESQLANIIRGLYTCKIGNVIVKLDLMANEIRCWGSLSHDDNLKKNVLHGKELRERYFKEGPNEKLLKRVKLEGDIHRTNASDFNMIKIEKVTKDQRQGSKDTTFGTVYGLTTSNLAKRLKKTFRETQKIKRKFFSTFKKGKQWLDDTVKLAEKNLYVESPLGRRRRLWFFLIQYPISKLSTITKPELNYEDGFVSSRHGAGGRRAKNSPIQGIGSDFAFIAAFLMRAYIKKYKKNWKMFNVVHDSLETEIPIGEIKEYILVSKIIFERLTAKFLKKYFNYDLYIPIEVDYEVGFSLKEMSKWDGAFRTLDDLQDDMIRKTKTRKPTQDISKLDLAA